jgi:MFS family permease
MAAAGAIGALFGNLLFGWRGHVLPRRTLFALGYLGVPIALACLAFTPGMFVTLAVLLLLVLSLSLANMLEYTIYFERIPQGMRARVLGLSGALGYCTVPIGRLLGGLLLAAFGLAGTFGLLAVVFVPVLALLFLVPGLRDLQPPEALPTEP